MINRLRRLFLIGTLTAISGTAPSMAQSPGATISGTVFDPDGAVIAGVKVTVRNLGSGSLTVTVTDRGGRYLADHLPGGEYEIRFEAPQFPVLVRSGVRLDAFQSARVDANLVLGDLSETVTVEENASLLNSTTAEVATRFDVRRISDLPLSTNRNVFSIVLSAPGVNQLGSGQSAFAAGTNFSANGGRIRSNNFQLDGQDLNDPVFTGTGFPLNNPDAIQEVRLVTNQFKAEFGHNSGSIVSVVSRSGTNEYRGTLFWYHNNERLNSCSNLDKLASFAPTGYCSPDADTEERRRAPFRLENQFGFTLGGPLNVPRPGRFRDRIWNGRDRTFFFVDLQRWTDRSRSSGATLAGAPTEAGRAVLASIAAGRPQVQALLDFVPAGTPNGRFATFTIPNESPQLVELGSFTGSSPVIFNDTQGSARIDHRLDNKTVVWARLRADRQRTEGSGQISPPGFSLVNTGSATAFSSSAVTSFSARFSNEARVSWFRYRTGNDALYPSAKSIPSLEIRGLDLTNAPGLTSGPAGRTALGLPSNLPGSRRIKSIQIADSIAYFTGSHNLKFGGEFRSSDVRVVAFQNARGSLSYRSPVPSPGQPVDISNFVNDVAAAASRNFPVPGGDERLLLGWNEIYGFVQDDWQARTGLSLTFGIRYEYPGNSFGYLDEVNERIVAASGGDPAYRYGGGPETDINNLMPRLGFSWNPQTSGKGFVGLLTGGDKLVIRGGYARVYDSSFVNINANLFAAFPFLVSVPIPLNGAFAAIRDAVPIVTDPYRTPRWAIEKHFRSPAADQISLDVQRELTKNLALQVGYIRTRGTGLFRIVDANPCVPGNDCRVSAGARTDPRFEAIRQYTNAASSTYDALQISLTKRLSNDFSGGLYYTWSAFIDEMSDIFSPSASEVGVAQNPFDRQSDRARSSYDRPQRLTGNFVFELPVFRKQREVVGHLLGGWQVSSYFSLQSGAPFTVTLGMDPACAVCGVAQPETVRPNLATSLDLSSMTITELIAAGGRELFSTLLAGQRVGNAGRNILRADGFASMDLGVSKSTHFTERVALQLRADLFNAFNSRNFGIPRASFGDPINFLNQWITDGGNRRIRLGVRLVF